MLLGSSQTRIDLLRKHGGHEQTSRLTMLDELVALNPQERRELSTTLRQVSETFAEVPDGKTTSHVLGVLAHLLDPA